MQINPEKDSRAPRRIQSLEVGFRLISALEKANGALSLKEVAALAGMARSNAHLYLSTFVALELVARNAAGQYLLGPYALQLGLAALRQSNVVDATDHAMRALQAATGHAVHVSVWGNYGPTIVKAFDGMSAIPVAVRVGFVVPLLSSATGQVFLAHQPASMTQSILQKERQNASLDEPMLAARLQRVRDEGYASSDNAFYEGCSALSAPVFDHSNRICAALAVLDLTARLGPEQRGESVALLKRAVAQTEVLLGRA
jgi:DNA-binding IclR family transcriptional regulator